MPDPFIVLVLLHTLDGQPIHINPQQVTSVAVPGKDPSLVDAKAKCIVSFVNRRFVPVLEECDEVRDLLKRK